jgi:hypothetical protein
LHDMAYYIFLKSLRSLEEFRKILMTKFLLNLLLQISKAFVYSKIQFLFEKNFFSEFGPASPVLARSAPQAAARVHSAHPGLRGLGVIAKSRLYFKFAQPDDDAFSLCHCPPCRRPAPRMPPSFYIPPSSLSPLIPFKPSVNGP